MSWKWIWDISPLDYHSILCVVAGAAFVGLERQLMGKPIGIRTSSLISFGTYIFVAMAQSIISEQMDPSRIIGQIITGIGFLGAGVMFSQNGSVQGVTSAAAIWILAAIGAVGGLGYPHLSVKIGILAVLLLVGIEKVERTFTFMQRGVHRRVQQYRDRSPDKAKQANK